MSGPKRDLNRCERSVTSAGVAPDCLSAWMPLAHLPDSSWLVGRPPMESAQASQIASRGRGVPDGVLDGFGAGCEGVMGSGEREREASAEATPCGVSSRGEWLVTLLSLLSVSSLLFSSLGAHVLRT
jgi:hypothetical protein